MRDPLTVTCTLCCSPMGQPCRTRTGSIAPRTHRQRIVRVAMWPTDDATLTAAFPTVGTR